jgi:hypothetical protein
MKNIALALCLVGLTLAASACTRADGYAGSQRGYKVAKDGEAATEVAPAEGVFNKTQTK